MSECLIQIIAPYSDAASTKKQMENLVGMALIAWNLALSSGEENAKLRSMLPVKIEDKEVSDKILSRLIERKIQLFPDDLRRPMHFTVSSRGDTWNIQVQSAVPLKERF